MTRRMLLDRLLKLLFWTALAFAYVAALLPPAEAPSFAPDKIEHFVVFVVLALLAAMAWRRTNVAWIGIGLIGFGALIEFSQMVPSLHRDADWKDWAVDGVAIAIGLLAAALVRPFIDRLAESSR